MPAAAPAPTSRWKGPQQSRRRFLPGFGGAALQDGLRRRRFVQKR